MVNTDISLYSIFILLAILSELVIVYINIKDLKYTKEEIHGLLLYIFLGGVLGGKYLAFFANYDSYDGIFKFVSGGYLAYGSLIGSLIMAFIFTAQFEKKFKDLFIIIFFSSPLMYSIGKIACLLTGCCYGIEYSGPLSITYNYSFDAPNGVSLFPIQLVESIIFMIIFIVLYSNFKKGKNKDILLLFYLFVGSFFKFSLEFLRMSHVGKILSLNQIIALLIIIGCFIYCIYKKKELSK